MKLLLILALALPLRAQDKLFQVSQFSFAAASVADTVSSWNGPELNPVLGAGRFRASQAAIKESVTGALLLSEKPIIKRMPRAKRWFTVLNFAAAAVTAGMAIRNEEIE